MAALAVKPLLRRSLLAVTALVPVVASLSCVDVLSDRGASARIVLEPRFAERDAAIYRSLRTFGLGATTVQIFFIRPNTTDTIARHSVALADGQDEVRVAVDVPIRGGEEWLSAKLEIHSGEVLIFSGTVMVLAKAGTSVTGGAPVLVPVWVGPGVNATRIEISPRDLALGANGRVAFTATAFDVAGQPITDPDFVTRWQWRVDNPLLGSIPLSGGEFVSGTTAGVAIVSVFTPNLLADTVRVTVVTQGAAATIDFATGIAVIDNGAAGVLPAVTARDAFGNTVPTPTLTYVSRDPNVVSVNTNGGLTGVARGQAVVVANGGSQTLSDSVLVVVAEPGAPVVVSSIDRFEYGLDQNVVVSVFADMRSTTRRLGSTAIDVEWTPGPLLFQSFANGASGVVPTVNVTAAPNGRLTLAMADVAGFSGRVELVRLTFRTSSSAGTGQLRLVAHELTAHDFADLLSITTQVTHPLFIH
jgi:hypothetical protein